MRIPILALTCAALAAGAAFAVNPSAMDRSGVVLHSTLRDVAGNAAAIPTPADIRPGDVFAITGDCVAKVNSADQLRVVLTFADAVKAETGFRSVVPTDQTISDNALHVRAPNFPETVNRVFDVEVFTLGQITPEVCEAGAIRIGGAATGKVG
jgi:hypothetical protein